jgi:hypothetical protein
MNAQNQDTFLWCKSQFEIALRMFRLGCGELDFPRFGDERFEAEMNRNILTIQRRVANKELIQCYLMSLNRKSNDLKTSLAKTSHKVGEILFEYFEGEGQAIRYLEGVSVTALLRLTRKQRDSMLLDKVPDDPFVRGPNFKWTGDMWSYVYEMAQSFDFYASTCTKRSYKRKQDPSDDLSDPPCAVRCGKRVRTIVYHI